MTFVEQVYVAAKEFDEKAKISSTLKQGYSQLESLAQEHKLKDKAHSVAEKTGETVKKVDERLKISETAAHLNEKYQISAKATQAQVCLYVCVASDCMSVSVSRVLCLSVSVVCACCV